MFPNKNEPQGLFRQTDTDSQPARLPKRPYVAAVGKLAQAVPGTDVDFDHFGDVRYLTTDNPQGFVAGAFNGKPLARAKKVLKDETIAKALGLSGIDLRGGTVTEVPSFGYRVTFRQVLTVKDVKRPVQVRGGYVHISMDKCGRVFAINSTLRRGRKPSSLGKIISTKEAIAAAKAAHGVPTCEISRCTLTLSAHNGHIDPVYEVVLCSCEPKKLVQYLVKANTGTVVYQENKLHYGGKRRGASTGVAIRTLLSEPDPEVDIRKQIHDALIAGLPNPRLLENQRMSMKVRKGGKWVTVQAKADGTFNFDYGTDEFDAVVSFFAMNSQFEFCEAQGMTANYKQIPVFVNDPSVQDNAYFDPENWEVHLGIGSGAPNGLTRHICLSIMVEMHEEGHEIVAIVTPGGDLPGSEGAGCHEASGDFFALLSNFRFRLIYGKELGKTLTKSDVQNDPGYVGPYSLPPTGIRAQKNHKRTPQDKTGEPHDDGEIVGGALFDMLVAMATKPEVDLMDGLNSAGKLYLSALALVPAHKVLFKDILRALITADQTLNGGANKQLITKAFAGHGITLGGSGQVSLPRQPKGPSRRKQPRKQPRRRAS